MTFYTNISDIDEKRSLVYILCSDEDVDDTCRTIRKASKNKCLDVLEESGAVTERTENLTVEDKLYLNKARCRAQQVIKTSKKLDSTLMRVSHKGYEC